MPLLLTASMAGVPTSGPGILPWPKAQPYDFEKQKRYAAERIEAARLKRERKAAKRTLKP